MYQEMDSEEEECTSHGGTLPRRDSVTSHQSARVVLRSQSTKSHRRTGSRAEAKRASILSKHTAFSSPMVGSHCSLSRHFSRFVFPSWTPVESCYAIIYPKERASRPTKGSVFGLLCTKKKKGPDRCVPASRPCSDASTPSWRSTVKIP